MVYIWFLCGVFHSIFTRNINAIDYSAVAFTPLDVKNASASGSEREMKPYTIMVYMNGSEFEGENGAATDDLIVMLVLGLNSDNANMLKQIKI